jgi:hypothetical protein
MEIPDIRIDTLDIQEIRIPDPPVYYQNALPPVAPVTEQLGFPVVNIPGCVQAHSQNNKKNKNLVENDPKGTITYCDAGTPSYDPIQYEPDQIVPTYPAGIDTRSKQPEPEVPETPEVSPPILPKAEVFVCPTREQELKNPVGKILEGNKKIVGYEQVGKECLMVTEELTIPDQILGNIPNPGMVTTTASIAVVATSSALLAKPVVDLLLKVVKPTVKKVMKKIATMRGKSPKVESLRDRRGQQRIRNKAIRILKGRE